MLPVALFVELITDHNARDWNFTPQQTPKAITHETKWKSRFISFSRETNKTRSDRTYRISMTPGCCDGTRIQMENVKENRRKSPGEWPWESSHARHCATDSRVSVPLRICGLLRGVFGHWFWFIHDLLFQLFLLPT